MPLYEYRCKTCKLQVEIVRSIKEHADLPTEEEIRNAAVHMAQEGCELPEHDFEKIITKAPHATYGGRWSPFGSGGGKGNW